MRERKDKSVVSCVNVKVDLENKKYMPIKEMYGTFRERKFLFGFLGLVPFKLGEM